MSLVNITIRVRGFENCMWVVSSVYGWTVLRELANER